MINAEAHASQVLIDDSILVLARSMQLLAEPSLVFKVGGVVIIVLASSLEFLVIVDDLLAVAVDSKDNFLAVLLHPVHYKQE